MSSVELARGETLADGRDGRKDEPRGILSGERRKETVFSLVLSVSESNYGNTNARGVFSSRNIAIQSPHIPNQSQHYEKYTLRVR